MRYIRIKTLDIADGPGCRVSLFVSGCRKHCQGCFNPESWSFDTGDPYTDVVQEQILAAMNHNYVSGLTVLGGEPFEPENAESVYKLISAARETFGESKSLWAYSGHLIEDLVTDETCFQTIKLLDVLVDGPFVEDQKDLRLQYCGSRNQRVIDIKASREKNALMVHDLYDFYIPVVQYVKEDSNE